MITFLINWGILFLLFVGVLAVIWLMITVATFVLERFPNIPMAIYVLIVMAMVSFVLTVISCID